MYESNWSHHASADVSALALIAIAVLAVFVIVLTLFVWGMIFRRAGYSFATALLMFLPVVNVIWLLIFAFTRWPIQKELDAYQRQVPQYAAAPPPPAVPPRM
jgi:membrane-anchored protein YejM (alkaline phosphatase superfamily)